MHTTGAVRCRFCASGDGTLVLDLGEQPPPELFVPLGAPDPEPRFPVRLWLCGGCGLVQLADRDEVPEEVVGVEPEALRVQRAEAAGWLAGSGLCPPPGVVAEYGSPHGGSWLPELSAAGLVGRAAGPGERGDLVVDGCFGIMHAADQCSALAERAGRLRAGGLLVLQYHSLAAIVRYRQWNAIRLNHVAYYSTPAMREMVARVGLTAVAVRESRLYGGTVTLVAARGPRRRGDGSVEALCRREREVGVASPPRLAALHDAARSGARRLVTTLASAGARGERVLGYGAASRAVPLLALAGVGASALPAVADSSPAKHGMRMPGTDIPVITPGELVRRRPHRVLLFVPDLLAEVRRSLPEIEGSGGRWQPVVAGSG